MNVVGEKSDYYLDVLLHPLDPLRNSGSVPMMQKRWPLVDQNSDFEFDYQVLVDCIGEYHRRY